MSTLIEQQEPPARNDNDAVKNRLFEELEAARNAFSMLTKNDITELKSLSMPPKELMEVMKAACVLFLPNEKPTFSAARMLFNDPHFLDRCVEFDANRIDADTLLRLQQFTHAGCFPEHLYQISKPGCCFFLWLVAVERYATAMQKLKELC